MLLELVRPFVSAGSTVLDVGGGIGVLDQELLRMGAGHAVIVDASPAYLDVARDEARRRMTLDRIELVEGDFVARAPWVERADIVTLDRVVCCYPDAESLVASSAARARRVYGLVLPRDSLLSRLGVGLLNLGYRVRRQGYRAFAHPNALVDRLAGAHGLGPIAERKTWFWRVVVYAPRPVG
jgi:magnesium-protoporphyrin O-methyltransferase